MTFASCNNDRCTVNWNRTQLTVGLSLIEFAIEPNRTPNFLWVRSPNNRNQSSKSSKLNLLCSIHYGNWTQYQGWTLNFESTRHSGTRPDQFSLAQKFTPHPRVFPTILVIFYFYYWRTIEIYFNTKRLPTSATVNRKFQFLFTAVLLPVDTACAFLKSNLSLLLVCCLSSCCRARFAGFFSGHKLTLWHCFARRWAALFSWYDMRLRSISINLVEFYKTFWAITVCLLGTNRSQIIPFSSSLFNDGRPTCSLPRRRS